MKGPRRAALVFLVALGCICVFPRLVTPADYAQQLRDAPDASPSAEHVLGTDALGRDRLARLVYGTRISLSLAPAAALLTTLLAALIGGFGGFAGGWVERAVMAAADLVLSLPWLFLLITVRAFLPLNVAPMISVTITFALLGCLGWAAAARVICADVRTLRESDFVLLAHATGCGRLRLLWRHVLPNLRPILLAQFWISIPVFILTEANLGILGLGVAEPLPSWGGLLVELESFSSLASQPWLLAPLLLLVLTVVCFQTVLQG